MWYIGQRRLRDVRGLTCIQSRSGGMDIERRRISSMNGIIGGGGTNGVLMEEARISHYRSIDMMSVSMIQC